MQTPAQQLLVRSSLPLRPARARKAQVVTATSSTAHIAAAGTNSHARSFFGSTEQPSGRIRRPPRIDKNMMMSMGIVVPATSSTMTAVPLVRRRVTAAAVSSTHSLTARPPSISYSTTATRSFSSRTPLLFTPGPLTTSVQVKNALLQDVGSRDPYFLDQMHAVREKLVLGANTTTDTHDSVLIQGAGTHAIESVLGSACSGPNDKVLILNNGAYGERQKQICKILKISFESLDYSDDVAVSAADLEARLEADGHSFSHVSFIHHETTAGVLNPLTELCQVVERFNAKTTTGKQLEIIVDSMSAFGAYEVDLQKKHKAVKYLISSANKCIEGVPGFAFAIYEKEALERLAERKPKSLALDLFAQAKGLSTGNRQFRFTPPTQAILAYHQALLEWEEEGGWKGRGGRYRENYDVIINGLEKKDFGLEFYVKPEYRGYIITTVLSPTNLLKNKEKWDFQFLYDFLATRGFVIYPGKLAKADSFRIGTIGKIYPEDCENFLLVLKQGFDKMGITKQEILDGRARLLESDVSGKSGGAGPNVEMAGQAGMKQSM
ncbi:unnamed protein product [Amoebophrya sp. A120]|nr:unnamed protein product [Amoebophrya sp. A120]|eukprot:GSA120T00014433001.1